MHPRYNSFSAYKYLLVLLYLSYHFFRCIYRYRDDLVGLFVFVQIKGVVSNMINAKAYVNMNVVERLTQTTLPSDTAVTALDDSMQAFDEQPSTVHVNEKSRPTVRDMRAVLAARPGGASSSNNKNNAKGESRSRADESRRRREGFEQMLARENMLIEKRRQRIEEVGASAPLVMQTIT